MEIEFLNIRNFRKTSIEFAHDIILVGQNDHGKSSVFKILDVAFNKLEVHDFQSYPVKVQPTPSLPGLTGQSNYSYPVLSGLSGQAG